MTERSEEVRLLTEIARWIREAALPNVRSRIERLVDSEAKKRVYDAIAEGTAAVRSVEKLTGINHNDISRWLKDWEAEGIVEAGANPPRAQFTLRELGIRVPPRPTSRLRKELTQ